MKDNSHSIAYVRKPFLNQMAENPQVLGRKGTDPINKTFFSTIKNQLNNIRTDVSKLVSKETKESSNKSYSFLGANRGQIKDYTPQRVSFKRDVNDGMQTDTKVMELQTYLSAKNKKNQELMSMVQFEKRNSMQLRQQIYQLKKKLNLYQKQFQLTSKELQEQRIWSQKLHQQKENYALVIKQLDSRQREQSKCREQTCRQNIENNTQIKRLQQQIKLVIEENEQLRKSKLQIVSNDKSQQIEQIRAQFEQKLQRAEAKTYKQLGASFQTKICDLLDQNYSLKQKVGFLESELEQLQVQNQSFQSTISAYELRDCQQGKSALQTEVQTLMVKVREFQDQKDKIQSDYEFQIMKLQNKIDEIKSGQKSSQQHHNFNYIIKQQICQIENLKQKVRNLSEIISKKR